MPSSSLFWAAWPRDRVVDAAAAAVDFCCVFLAALVGGARPMDPLEVSLCFLGNAAVDGIDDDDLGRFVAAKGGGGGGGAIGLTPSLSWTEGLTASAM